jgi:hypothetical protein
LTSPADKNKTNPVLDPFTSAQSIITTRLQFERNRTLVLGLVEKRSQGLSRERVCYAVLVKGKVKKSKL